LIDCNSPTYTAPAADTRRNRPTIGGGIGGLLVDGTCLLKSISDNGSAHEFTYAPSGLRVRDKRTGANAVDKRFVYTTSGALLSVHESPSKRRDIVYANGEAIAEIDANGNIYELHNDHLGTPRYITSRSTGKIAGEQAFGPYGEELAGNYNGQTLPTGYKPATGYTGHLNEDLSGLIYMKGRYYSPLWHRFINSDQGVDPRSINQYAYVGGFGPGKNTDNDCPPSFFNRMAEWDKYLAVHGVGITGIAEAGAGAIVPGHVLASGSAMVFWNSNDTGFTTSAGAGFTFGAYAGTGTEIVLTNARSANDLKGNAYFGAINAGLGAAKWSLSFSVSRSAIWSLSIGPPWVGLSVGASFSFGITNTWRSPSDTPVTQKPGCK
jgi:RHS repeat-associated protein